MILNSGNKMVIRRINEDELKIGVLNMITANTGCGKTTWAVDYLMRKVNNKYQVVYLIDGECKGERETRWKT